MKNLYHDTLATHSGRHGESQGPKALPYAVVIGACGHGLSVIRALKAGGMPILVLEANKQLPGVITRLAEVQIVSDINGPGLIDALRALSDRINHAGTPVLFLTNDRMVRTVGDSWDHLEGLYRLSWAHCRHAVLPLLEKIELEKRSNKQGLAYPKTFLLTGTEYAARAIERVGFPLFVKPARPLARFKTAQPTCLEELDQLTRDYVTDLPFLVQSLIPGDDTTIYFTAAYLNRGKLLARFDGHKLRSRPLGHTTIAESVSNDEVFNQTIRFFEGLDLSGPVSLELKRDAQGRYWVIEPTVGRTDFWIDLCTANGVNFPLVEYLDQTLTPSPPQLQVDKFVWFNEERDPFGVLWFMRQKDLHLKGRRATFLYLHRSDIKPALNAIIAISRGLLRMATRRGRRVLRGAAEHGVMTVLRLRLTDEIPADVRQLLALAEAKEMEFGLGWYQNLMRTVYQDDEGVFIYVLRRNGQAVAALPVHVLSKLLGRTVEALSNFYTTLYEATVVPTVPAHDLTILINAIRRDHGPIGSFRFAPMDPQSFSYLKLADGLRSARLVVHQFFCFGNWFLPVGSDWQTYMEARPGILRSTISRMGKRFSKQGGRLELILGGSDLERGLSAYAAVYAASWKRPEPFIAFLPNLARILAQRGTLRLGIAWLREQPIAAQIWIVANGRAKICKLAYHKDYKALAPGTLLTAMLMQHVMENDGVAEVDYLNGDEPYKQNWMSHRRERWGIVAYDPITLRGAIGLCREIIGKMLRRSLSTGRSH